MKRLLIDINSVVPYYISGKVSGIGRTTLELIQALAEEKDLPFEIMLYSQNIKGIGGKNTGLPFSCRHLYMRNNGTWNRIIARFPIREWLTRYDIMHIPSNHEYVYRPEKCIFTLHDALFMKMQEAQFGHVKMKQIVPPLMRQCKHIITCSESSKRDIVETMHINPDKITVIYWGVKHDVFFPRNDKTVIQRILTDRFQISRPYFLSVSCGAERKRTDVLLRSYIEFCKQAGVRHDLVLVWSNPPKEISNTVKDCGFSNHIHLLNAVTDEELALLYNGATALFFPSSYEGFGLPVLEAMACGTPVATCRNSSLSEIADDAAIYLEEPVEESMTRVMKRIISNEYPFEELKLKGTNRAAMFRWSKCAKQTIEVYQQCLHDI